jgi:protein-L-isoaspartate(D-aspartate) O-methyltransferase
MAQQERPMDFDAARKAMVEGQILPSDVTRTDIALAMRAIPREAFAPRALREIAYADLQLEVAPGRRMLDPRSFAKLLSAAAVDSGALVLDVGCATGYSTAVLGRIAGYVVGLECDEDLAAQAAQKLETLNFANASVETGALPAGAPASGPYDAIIVEGAVQVEPTALLDQLKDGGRLVAIRGAGQSGRATVWRRRGDLVSAVAVFDATANVLPGFDAEPAFSF